MAIVLAGLLVVAGGTATTVAQSGQAAWADDLYDGFDAMVPSYNGAVDPDDYGLVNALKWLLIDVVADLLR